MNASRTRWGLAVLVTAILLFSSLGLAGVIASARTPTSASSAAPLAAASTPSLSAAAPSAAPSGTPHFGTAATTALLSAKTPPLASGNPSAIPTPSGRMGTALSTLRASHVPLKDAFLPNLNAPPNPTLVNGHITPGYGTAPAPLGVAEYGLKNVSGTITPYDLYTTSIEGTYQPYAMNGLSQDISGPDEYGVQLNAVLQNVTLLGSTGYDFWTQNVLEYSVYSSQLLFVSNIWNFTNPLYGMSANSLYQHGTGGVLVNGSLYYNVYGPISITYPFTVDLFLNSTLVGGRDAVYFNYSISNDTEQFSGSFDYAIFNSVAAGGAPASPPIYIASGSAYNALNLPDDFEMVLGGPGGGSNFDVLQSEAYIGLQFLNATTDQYSTVPSAYGWGSETGETSTGAYVLWGNPFTGLGGGGNPDAFLAAGPSILQGLWNVSSAPPAYSTYGGYLKVSVSPANAFLFIAPGSVFTGWDTTNWSLFQWAPLEETGSFELDPGSYTVVAVQSDYDPVEATVTVTLGATTPLTLTLNSNVLEGVYTPLWALDNGDLANIGTLVNTSYVLYSNEYGPIGDAAYLGVNFPWFGAANDYLFPVFPGIFLEYTSDTTKVLNAPDFKAYYPAPLNTELAQAGFPVWNDLQMLFWNTSHVELAGAANIGGWWYAGAYEGPADSAYNVVFWNTTDSLIFDNTFDTGGNALYMYGGSYNVIFNNTFEESVPLAPNEEASVAGTWGSTGIFEGDYGNATDVAAHLGVANDTIYCLFTSYCDAIFNNIFLTEFTADSPYTDPYYFFPATPTCPAYLGISGTCYFDDAWNAIPSVTVFGETWSTSIIGTPGLGGNFWWNYGQGFNPYNEIPYDAFAVSSFTDMGTGIYFGGDYLPLSLVPLYTVSFVETGLPAGAEWYSETFLNGGAEYGDTDTNTSNLTLPAGTYLYTLGAFSPYFAAPGGQFTVTDANLVIDVVFSKAYTLTFTETGLPAGAYWFIELCGDLNPSCDFPPANNTTTITISALLPETYLWEAFAESGPFEASPFYGNIALAANTTIDVHFSTLHTFTVNVSGLSVGSWWSLLFWNATFSEAASSDQPNQTVVGPTGAGSFNWSVSSVGYVATPSSGVFSLAANSSVAVTFAAAATVTFTETGLSSGAAWTVSLTQNGATSTQTSSQASIVMPAEAGAFTYTVSAAGYTASPASGSGTLPGGSPVDVSFSVPSGTLSLTVATGGATATVNGGAVTLPFSGSEAPGVYAIVVSESGYLTYYNNVSVASGKTSTLSVTLTAKSSSPSTSSSSGISSMAWLLIAVLAALAVVFLITTLLFMRRGKTPPKMTAYSPPPAAGTTAAAPAAPPAWSEGAPPASPPPGAR